MPTCNRLAAARTPRRAVACAAASADATTISNAGSQPLAALADIDPFGGRQFGHARGVIRTALWVEPAAGTTSSNAFNDTSQ